MPYMLSKAWAADASRLSSARVGLIPSGRLHLRELLLPPDQRHWRAPQTHPPYAAHPEVREHVGGGQPQSLLRPQRLGRRACTHRAAGAAVIVVSAGGIMSAVAIVVASSESRSSLLDMQCNA